MTPVRPEEIEMPAILDGRVLSRKLNQGRVKTAAAKLDRPPGLAAVLVGSDPASFSQ